MGNKCLLTRRQSRLPLHHGTVMVRLVTGFFIDRCYDTKPHPYEPSTINLELEGSSSLF